jgi:hypothetical protein
LSGFVLNYINLSTNFVFNGNNSNTYSFRSCRSIPHPQATRACYFWGTTFRSKVFHFWCLWYDYCFHCYYVNYLKRSF